VIEQFVEAAVIGQAIQKCSNGLFSFHGYNST
jgi:hypothetical protein